MDWVAERDLVIAHAIDQGFAAAGVAGLRPFRKARRRALAAIDEGRLEGMPWFNRERVDAAADLRRRHPWARAAISIAWPYQPAVALRRLAAGQVGAAPAGDAARPRGRVAAYACLTDADTESPAAVDYHDLLSARCDDLVAWLRERHPRLRANIFVDHGWAMDKPTAERAGIGFGGKNTTLITQAAGSYVVLADVLVSVPLPSTEASRRSCGTCRACLPACPTEALVAPGVMDARRCISYLTIEHKGAIPLDLRPLMGTWIFGCDLCMEACPINQRLAPVAIEDPGPATAAGPVPFPDLVECLALTDSEFEARFRRTAVWRTRRSGLARNAAIALGNYGDTSALQALEAAAQRDPDAVVREAARWAIGRLSNPVGPSRVS